MKVWSHAIRPPGRLATAPAHLSLRRSDRRLAP
jgi:hypothetical protein